MIQGMAFKILSEVEVNHWASNQHEFNGVASLKRIFGLQRQYFNAKFIFMSDAGIESIEKGSLTWYDARENHPYRTEYRLYYDAFLPLQRASAGDALLITVDDAQWVNVCIIKQGTQLVNFLVNQIKNDIGSNYSILTDDRVIDSIQNFLAL